MYVSWLRLACRKLFLSAHKSIFPAHHSIFHHRRLAKDCGIDGAFSHIHRFMHTFAHFITSSSHITSSHASFASPNYPTSGTSSLLDGFSDILFVVLKLRRIVVQSKLRLGRKGFDFASLWETQSSRSLFVAPASLSPHRAEPVLPLDSRYVHVGSPFIVGVILQLGHINESWLLMDSLLMHSNESTLCSSIFDTKNI